MIFMKGMQLKCSGLEWNRVNFFPLQLMWFCGLDLWLKLLIRHQCFFIIQQCLPKISVSPSTSTVCSLRVSKYNGKTAGKADLNSSKGYSAGAL